MPVLNMGEIKHIDFFGLKISVFENNELKNFIDKSIISNNKRILYGYSLGSFPYFKKHPEIAVYSNQFDVSVADGRGLYLFARALGYPLKSDLSIPLMSEMVLELAQEKRYSVLLLGAKEEINKKATENLRLKFPGARILDGKNGYFSEEDERSIVDFINAQKPDILLVGISSPIKERFAFRWGNELCSKIIIPCGGLIDVFSGKTKPMPVIVKKLCLGAIYRFVQEPRRLFRDSIVYTSSVIFRLIPALIFNVYVLGKKNFSIPKFYYKACDNAVK
jgi:N-acetylglucosaminyldiphosphoundecaprenol N-acetyl-beta-D-mannosaminyltransferase